MELEHEVVAGVVAAARGDALAELLQVGLQLGVLHLQVLELPAEVAGVILLKGEGYGCRHGLSPRRYKNVYWLWVYWLREKRRHIGERCPRVSATRSV